MMKKIRRETEIKNQIDKSATCVSGRVSTRQHPSSVFPTKLDSNQSPQLQNFACGKSRYDTFQ